MSSTIGPAGAGAWPCWWPGSWSPPRSSCSAPRSGSSARAPAPGPVGTFATVAVLAGLAAGWSPQARRSSTGVLVAAASGDGGRGGDPPRSDHAAAPARPAPGGRRAAGRRARRGRDRRRGRLRGPLRPPGRAPDPRGDARGAPLAGRAARRLRRERRPRQPGRRSAAHPRRVDAPGLAAVPGGGLDRARRPDGGAELHLGRPRGPGGCAALSSCRARWTRTPTPFRPRSTPPSWACCAARVSPGGLAAAVGAAPVRGPRGGGPVGPPQLRFAPALHGGSVLALVVTSGPRPRAVQHGGRAGLAEVARRLAIVLRNRSLDSALQETLDDLRRANADLRPPAAAGAAADADAGASSATSTTAPSSTSSRWRSTSVWREACAGARRRRRAAEEWTAASRAIAQVRDLAHGIYPPLLRESGLEEALRPRPRSPVAVTVVATGWAATPSRSRRRSTSAASRRCRTPRNMRRGRP